MKKTLQAYFVLSLLVVFSFEIRAASSAFPLGPQLSITPGKLCDRPNEYRYPEKIAYCERDVNYETKETLINEYDQKFGYSVANLPRADFKIDHFIPLCAGGSNDIVNLWPQHKTVYAITDPLEPLVCAKMQTGRLKQAEAVKLVVIGKTDLSRTKAVIQYLNSL
jgi:hypothetical protein